MIVKKPSIYIYTNQPEQSILREIYSGIEEEGIFYEMIERDIEDLNQLAWDAANDSMLGSGIGVKGKSIAFQMRGVKIGKNVEFYANPLKEESRRLGANSARAVKKQGFK